MVCGQFPGPSHLVKPVLVDGPSIVDCRLWAVGSLLF